MKKFTFTFFIFLILSWTGLFAQVAVVKVSPPESYIELNTVVEVFVLVENILACRAYSTQLSYDSQLIRCLSITQGTFFSGWNTFFFTIIDSNLNLIKVDEAILGSGYENGSGELYKVEFLALSEGDVNLNFIHADFRDTLNNQIQLQTENGILHVVDPTNVDHENENKDINVLKAYPNPFNSSTKIEFISDSLEETDLSIYAVTGERVFSLEFPTTGTSRKSFIWNGKNSEGNTLPSGIYLLMARSKGTTKTFKLIMLK